MLDIKYIGGIIVIYWIYFYFLLYFHLAWLFGAPRPGSSLARSKDAACSRVQLFFNIINHVQFYSVILMEWRGNISYTIMPSLVIIINSTSVTRREVPPWRAPALPASHSKDSKQPFNFILVIFTVNGNADYDDYDAHDDCGVASHSKDLKKSLGWFWRWW